MDYKYINQLLERYWNGETSLEEENILRSFFSQEEVPAALKVYQRLFLYEQREMMAEGLGADFDEKVMRLIGNAEEDAPKQVKVISLTERLKPLFKAAAIVAIFLTLGNAMQVPFNNHNAEYVGHTDEVKPVQGASVAMSDSMTIDTVQHTSIDQAITPPTPTLIK